MPSARTLLGAALIAVLGLTAYSTALRAGFIWDDDAYVTQNETLRSVGGLGRIWCDVQASPQYYPLVFTTFWVEYHLWGLRPGGYHFVNVLLHVTSALLLWTLLRRLSVPGAWLAAMIFAVHPVHVESVAWITERKNVLSGVFYLASFLAYLRFASGRQPRRTQGGAPPRLSSGARSRTDGGQQTTDATYSRLAYAAALVLFACGLLSKTVVCTLPAAILVVLWWKRGRILWRDILALSPMLALALTFAFVTVWVERNHVGAEGRDWTLTFPERFLLAGRVFWFYLGKLLWPHPLIFVYPRWEVSAAVWWQYLYPGAAAGLLVVLFVLRRQISRGPLVAALLFAGTLFPALGFIDVYPFRYSYVADHFQYLASMAPIALIASALSIAGGRLSTWLTPDSGGRKRGRKVVAATVPAVRWLPIVGGGALAAILVVLTARQCRMYENAETLWLATLARNPDAWLAHHNLAKIYEVRGDFAKAIEHNERTLRLHPDDPDAHNNLGIVFARQGKPEQAAAQYRRALAVKPDSFAAHSNLAILLLNLGRLDEAIVHFRAAIRLDERRPNQRHPELHCNLGMALSRKGLFDEAVASYRAAAQLAPAFADIRVDLGNVYMSAGRFGAAVDAYQEALRLSPNHARAREALQAAKARMERG